MQYSVAAILALAASASAWSNVTYTTEVVTALTTVCPASTQLTYNGVTYTVTESTTLTITNCPCTLVKPVTTTPVVVCETCVAPTTAPVYVNTTTPCPTTTTAAVVVKTSAGSVGTTSSKSAPASTLVPASGANKAFALSGASLAGLLGLAAYLL